jgi:type IV pilus assembly protein PilB
LDAIKKGSSDLHFRPSEKNLSGSFRTDGVCRNSPPTDSACPAHFRSPQVMAGLDSISNETWDGQLKCRISKANPSIFRMSVPDLWAKKIVVEFTRLSAQMGIDALGYEASQRPVCMAALKQSQGVEILVTGQSRLRQKPYRCIPANILLVMANISTTEDQWKLT